MSSKVTTQSHCFAYSFELVCVAVTVAVVGFFLHDAIGRSEAAARKTVQDAVEHAEEAISGQMGQQVETVFDQGFALAKDVLKPANSSSPAANDELPIDRLDQTLRRATRIFSQTTDEIIGLDEAEERKTGRDVHEMVLSQHSFLNQPEELMRIEQLAEPLLEQRLRKSIEYRFFIIDSDATNAFAHIGGYIYINRGLLDITSTNDDALQFVLGHEIAHSELRHCARNMTALIRADEILPGSGSLAAIAYRAISLGYSEADELESDLWSYQRMVGLGKSHQQAMQGLMVLKNQLGDKTPTVRDSRKRTPIDIINAHFRTHPPLEERIDQLLREHARRASN